MAADCFLSFGVGVTVETTSSFSNLSDRNNHGNGERTGVCFSSRMTSGSAPGGNAQKQDISVFAGAQKTCSDQTKEDGIRKELYESERKARENWPRKWGFFKSAQELWKKEAMKRGLNIDALAPKSARRNLQTCFENKMPSKVTPLPSGGVPEKCSGMIGWRSWPKENNLEMLAGPLYVSRKLTMNPPLGPEEPDLRYQKIIFLG